MQINLKKTSVVYVATPANRATGGIELLHQLCFHLREFGINSYVYFLSNDPNPIHSEYQKYNNPFVRAVVESEDNVLILPEIYTGLIYKYKKFKKVIWWLSVDNYFRAVQGGRLDIIMYIVKFLLKKVGVNLYYKFENNIPNLYHLVQSDYAKQFLLSKGIREVDYLSDYLSDDFISQSDSINCGPREDIVVYNPRKGCRFTKKIISLSRHLKFVPIINMRHHEVIDLLKKSKVYIDFGNHPGKDRIPREAAISGCCVITGMKGSAKYFEDVPIPVENKFPDNPEMIPSIIKKIEVSFLNYEIEYQKFNSYREKIKREKEIFLKDLGRIFRINILYGQSHNN